MDRVQCLGFTMPRTSMEPHDALVKKAPVGFHGGWGRGSIHNGQHEDVHDENTHNIKHRRSQ